MQVASFVYMREAYKAAAERRTEAGPLSTREGGQSGEKTMRQILNHEAVSQEYIPGMKGSSSDPAWYGFCAIFRHAATDLIESAAARLDGLVKMVPAIGCVSPALLRCSFLGALCPPLLQALRCDPRRHRTAPRESTQALGRASAPVSVAPGASHLHRQRLPRLRTRPAQRFLDELRFSVLAARSPGPALAKTPACHCHKPKPHTKFVRRAST